MSTDQGDKNGTANTDAGTTKYLRNSKTISGRLDDELVMMDIEQGKYFSLNPVATRIWELLDNPMTLLDICMVLTYEYEVKEERCRQETREYLEEMVRMNLIEKIQ